MRIARDGWVLVAGPLAAGAACGLIGYREGWLAPAAWCAGLGAVGSLFMAYFFRDPERTPPADPGLLVAGADGLVRAVEDIREEKYLKADCVRISIFLSPFDVHVNRSPLSGVVRDLAYTPGRHLLTLRNAASEFNEHSSILIEGDRTRCLVRQIVGPVVRRVVYWLRLEQRIGRAERIGMMKFGSRLDMYVPRADVRVLVKKGDRVYAGVTPVAAVV